MISPLSDVEKQGREVVCLSSPSPVQHANILQQNQKCMRMHLYVSSAHLYFQEHIHHLENTSRHAMQKQARQPTHMHLSNSYPIYFSSVSFGLLRCDLRPSMDAYRATCLCDHS